MQQCVITSFEKSSLVEANSLVLRGASRFILCFHAFFEDNVKVNDGVFV